MRRAAEELRHRDVAAVVRRYEQGGGVVFLAGDEGIDRRRVLAAVARELRTASPEPAIVTGRFAGGRYEATEPPPQLERRIASVAAEVASAASPLVARAVPLVAQLIDAGAAARGVWESLGGRAAEPADAVRLLRAAADERPLAWLVDDAERASGEWWTDLLLRAAKLAAGDGGSRFLLVLALDGPETLGDRDDRDDREPDSLFVARRLVRAGAGDWLPLRRVPPEAVAEWIGEVSPAVVERLHRIAAGDADLTAWLWDRWVRAGAVREDAGGTWRAERGESMLVGVREAVATRLADATRAGGPRAAALAEDVLRCGAIEGPTFTAEVVAGALGRDRDEVIDLIDDVLAAGEEPLLRDAGGIEIGDRHLWRYAFADVALWRALAPGSADPAGAEAVASWLLDLYDGEHARVAAPLARLLSSIGASEEARHFRRMLERSAEVDVLLAEALWLLDADRGGWDERRMRRATAWLAESLPEIRHVLPLPEADRLLARAEELARAAGDLHSLGYMLLEHAQLLPDMQRFDAALEKAREALAVAEPLSHADLLAFAHETVGAVAAQRADHRLAREHLEAALAIRERSPEPHAAQNVRYMLGDLAFQEGDLDEARRHWGDALRAFRAEGDMHQVADALSRFGMADMASGEWRRAADRFAELMPLYEEIGSALGVAITHWHLGLCSFELGDRGAAATHLERALHTYEPLGGDATEMRELLAVSRAVPLIEARPGLSTADLCAALGMPAETVEPGLAAAAERGLIAHRGGGWHRAEDAG